MDPVFEGAQATTMPPYQYSQRDGVELIDDRWLTKYIAGPVFSDYTDADGTVHTAAEQEAAYCAQKDDKQAKRVRDDCNKRLADTDWTQVADSPVNQLDWALYRQALRDVPAQDGFPWDIDWPEQP